MKVVKCLEHIPKLCWGKVIKNDMLAVLDTSEMDLLYYLKPTDTFPLPTQGDKVEVRNYGATWLSSIFLFHNKQNDEKPFVVKRDDLRGVFEYAYIRPIEKEECNSLDFHFGNIQKSLDAIKLIKTDKS